MLIHQESTYGDGVRRGDNKKYKCRNLPFVYFHDGFLSDGVKLSINNNYVFYYYMFYCTLPL